MIFWLGNPITFLIVSVIYISAVSNGIIGDTVATVLLIVYYAFLYFFCKYTENIIENRENLLEKTYKSREFRKMSDPNPVAALVWFILVMLETSIFDFNLFTIILIIQTGLYCVLFIKPTGDTCLNNT